MFDGLLAVLFAQSALFYSAERQFVVYDLSRVDPGISGLDSFRPRHSPVDVAGPDGGSQAKDGIIGLLYGLVEILDSNNGKRRAETFLLQEPRRGVNVCHQGWLEIEALCRTRHPWVAALHRGSSPHASPHLPPVLRPPGAVLWCAAGP